MSTTSTTSTTITTLKSSVTTATSTISISDVVSRALVLLGVRVRLGLPSTTRRARATGINGTNSTCSPTHATGGCSRSANTAGINSTTSANTTICTRITSTTRSLHTQVLLERFARLLRPMLLVLQALHVLTTRQVLQGRHILRLGDDDYYHCHSCLSYNLHIWEHKYY